MEKKYRIDYVLNGERNNITIEEYDMESAKFSFINTLEPNDILDIINIEEI